MSIKIDPGEIIEKYYGSGNRIIQVELMNGKKYTGFITGFFYDNPDDQNIERWSFVEEKDINRNRISEAIDSQRAEITIAHKDIKLITFKK